MSRRKASEKLGLLWPVLWYCWIGYRPEVTETLEGLKTRNAFQARLRRRVLERSQDFVSGIVLPACLLLFYQLCLEEEAENLMQGSCLSCRCRCADSDYLAVLF
jgi:hypothetical protein